MIPSSFDYRRAASAEEAVGLLADNDGAKLLAGGHSLLPMMKLRMAAPTMLIDISAIDTLRGISHDGDDLVVGSLTTHAEIAAAALDGAHRLLAEAAAAIGDVQVRNRGTLGGSLAHGDPAADYGAAALALSASIEVTGPDGARSIDADDLFVGLLTTALEEAEIVTAVRFPAFAGAGGAYEKFAQPASGYAIVGVAAAITRGEDGGCTAARVAATGIADRPRRLTGAEEALVGTALDVDALQTAAEAACEGIDDLRVDLHADADYRRHLTGVMVKRAVQRAASSTP